VLRLANPVQRYDWGSTTAIPAFLGTTADGGPVAEVWMGAHPLAPSTLLVDGAEPAEPLDAAIAARPLELLGAEVVDRWGPRLPFLLKLLAADAPLSLQVHPTAEQAVAGYAREEADGPGRTAPGRRYRDAWHKPEIVLALTPFQALAGVRPPQLTLAVLHDLVPAPGPGGRGAPPALSAFGAALGRPVAGDAVRAAFDVVTAAGQDELAEASEVLAHAGGRRLAAGGGEHAQDDACLVELQRAHPGDPGVLLSTLLHHLTLQPGQCLYLAPGQLHAYRSGVAVEAMATSDNVLRAGLTHKHVDVAELAAVVDLEPAPAPVLAPVPRGPGALAFQPPVDDVGLDVVTLDGAGSGGSGGPGALPVEAGPRIVLVLDGVVELVAGRSSLVLRRGESVFVPAGEEPGVRGAGRLAVARVGRR
jgi:mannose-6-phosphate isomerase